MADHVFEGRHILQWHITHRCNLRCTHCYQTDYAAQMSREQLMDQVKRLVKHPGQVSEDFLDSLFGTGADGITVFETGQQKAYEVHVLQAPEGFKPDETVYNTPDTYSDVKIILEKAE